MTHTKEDAEATLKFAILDGIVKSHEMSPEGRRDAIYESIKSSDVTWSLLASDSLPETKHDEVSAEIETLKELLSQAQADRTYLLDRMQKISKRLNPLERDGVARMSAADRSAWLDAQIAKDEKRAREIAEGYSLESSWVSVTAPELLDAAVGVCLALDAYQRNYETNTFQPGHMPGNEYYSTEAMNIVVAARAVLAASRERKD